MDNMTVKQEEPPMESGAVEMSQSVIQPVVIQLVTKPDCDHVGYVTDWIKVESDCKSPGSKYKMQPDSCILNEVSKAEVTECSGGNTEVTECSG